MEDKIKVLHVLSDTNIGGAGKYLINYCNNYNKEKFEIYVLLPENSLLIKELSNLDVKLIQINGLKDNSKDYHSYKMIKNKINEISPDIVHTHASLVARIAAKNAKCKPKIVYTKHCDFEPSRIYKFGIIRFLFGRFTKSYSNRIIATSNHLKDSLISQGIDPSIIVKIDNGSDGYKTLSNNEINDIKSRYGIKDERVIGYLARLVELKGHKYLFDALKIIKDNNDIKFKCIIAGDGDYKEELLQYVKELDLQDNVIFTGFIENVEEILNIFDVQVNCSYLSETTNLSIIEGMSIGLPTVAFAIGGLPDMIQDNYNGYIVPIKDVDKLADKICEVISDDKKHSDLSSNSKECFNNRFTSKVFAQSIEKVYEDLINNK